MTLLLQGRSSELQQVQAKVSSSEGILKDCNTNLNLKKNEIDDLRMQLKQGLDRVYGQVSGPSVGSLSTKVLSCHTS